MNKKLLAVAVAALVAAPAIAAADTTLYGQMNFELQSVYDAEQDDNAFGTNSYGSRIGFKGSEDLGGGLKGVWQLEQGFNPTTLSGGGQWGSGRNTYIGLQGGFGTVLTGRHDHPYKIASLPFRNFGDTGVDGEGGFKAQSFLRTGGVIAYISPNIGGFQGLAAVVPFNDGTDDQTPYSLALTYKGGPLYATLAYEDMGDVPGLGYDTFLVGATYKLGGFTVGAMYEMTEDSDSGFETTRILAPLTWALNDSWKLRAAVKADDDDDDNDALDYALGGVYNFSKRTEAYANVWTVADADETEFGIGLRHKW